MILIHRFKKIKFKKAFVEILWDIVFFVVFFVLGVCFVFAKVENRGERAMVVWEDNSNQVSTTTSPVSRGKFVASSRGKYFYPVGSSRANSLSEQNKVYFDNEEEAKKQGFKPYIGN